MLELANLSLLSQLQRATFARRTVCYIAASQVWTCPADGWLVIRCLGAGGSGAAFNFVSGQPVPISGGSAGTVGVKRVRVSRGGQFTFVIPAGGASVATGSHGNAGGTLTVTGPGVDISIPGGPGGRRSTTGGGSVENDDAADPTGLDWFIKSARNTAGGGAYTGGAAPALLVGGQSHASTSANGASVTGNEIRQSLTGAVSYSEADYAAPVPPMDASHCWLLVDVSGAWVSRNGNAAFKWRSGQGGFNGAQGGFGGGGGGRDGGAQNSVRAGDGGAGAGGGAMRGTAGGTNQLSGAGGPGFVALELLEAQP